MNTTFAIGIPTINRKDLLLEALQVYSSTYAHTRVYIMDNGAQQITTGHTTHTVITNTTNYGVAKSWNALCRGIFAAGYNYALLLNDDIVMGSNETEVSNYLQQAQPVPDFIGGTSGLCTFILPKKTFDTVGPFDETFGNAYYEDDDYLYRLKLANSHIEFIPLLSPSVFRTSQTIAKTPELNKHFEANKAYYIKKWGGLPHKETYLTPFNK